MLTDKEITALDSFRDAILAAWTEEIEKLTNELSVDPTIDTEHSIEQLDELINEFTYEVINGYTIEEAEDIDNYTNCFRE